MRNVLAAAAAALIATAITATASHHHKRHHHPHGIAATIHQRNHSRETWNTVAQAYGRYTDDQVYFNHRRPTASAEALWRETHPDNIWLDFCFVDSYAQCGRDSAINHQRPGP